MNAVRPESSYRPGWTPKVESFHRVMGTVPTTVDDVHVSASILAGGTVVRVGSVEGTGGPVLFLDIGGRAALLGHSTLHQLLDAVMQVGRAMRAEAKGKKR